MDSVTTTKPLRPLLPHPSPHQYGGMKEVHPSLPSSSEKRVIGGVGNLKRTLSQSQLSPPQVTSGSTIKLETDVMMTNHHHPNNNNNNNNNLVPNKKVKLVPSEINLTERYPTEPMIREFNEIVVNQTTTNLDYQNPNPNQTTSGQSLGTESNFIPINSELITIIPFTTYDNNHPPPHHDSLPPTSSYSHFSYPTMELSPSPNKLLNSGLLNCSLVNTKPGILNHHYLNLLFDRNPNLDPKAKSHLESLVDISRYDQPELFHYLDHQNPNQDHHHHHSRQSSSHDNESLAGELVTAPGSPLYPAHLHWDLCQRPVSSPDLPYLEMQKNLLPDSGYPTNDGYINTSLPNQKSLLPISHPHYLPNTLILNSFDTNSNFNSTTQFQCQDSNFSEGSTHHPKNFTGVPVESDNTSYPKLKPKPYPTKTIVHAGLCQSSLANFTMSLPPKGNRKSSHSSLNSNLPKYIQVPLVTKSAWSCLYSVRKDGKPSTRATKMRLSEALTLIESQQVAAAFTNAGHPTPTICPYPRCDTPFNSDYEFLRHHILTHNPDRPFECPICNVAFQRDQDLSRHKNIHLQIKAFTCPHCQKTFGRRDAQQRHTLKRTCLPLGTPDNNDPGEVAPTPTPVSHLP